MIFEQTVFVLGAGSSVPYDFPSGEKLVSDICRKLAGQESRNDYRRLLRMAGIQDGDMDSLRAKLDAARPPSIDEFLQTHPSLVKVGKACIAASLG